MSDGRRKDEGAAPDGLPERWLEAARAYNDPPGTPREAMWTAIEARLSSAEGDAVRPPAPGGAVLSLDEARERGATGRRARRWLAPLAAAAAVLVVGIGIGRLTAPSPDGRMAAAPDAPSPSVGLPAPSHAVRAAAFEHLGRSESLLAMVRADARAGRLEGDVGRWGAGLLAETRLLLDSPAAGDPAMRELLEDLELILAQVAVLEGPPDGAGRAREELQIIARGLEERDVLSRIQAVLPAGPEATTWGI